MINVHSYLSKRRNQLCHKSYLYKLRRKYSNTLNKSLNLSFMNQTKLLIIFKIIMFITLFIVICCFITIWNKYSPYIHRSANTPDLYTPIDDTPSNNDIDMDLHHINHNENRNEWVSFGGYAGLPYFYSLVRPYKTTQNTLNYIISHDQLRKAV